VGVFTFHTNILGVNYSASSEAGFVNFDEVAFADLVGDVADYPILHYSKKQVVKAGKALRGSIPHDPDRYDEHVHIFKIAHDWRASHALPMRAIRADLIGRLRRMEVEGISAARIKRMLSIRKKLNKEPGTLAQMQDLGGCRAIVKTISDVNRLIEIYRGLNSFHKIRLDRSYIENPREDGYRSHHFVFEFAGTGDEAAFNGRRIELQIRSRLQHAWATAVEAVGLVRGEDLKGGEGNPNWLRLFTLMSSELAEHEGTPVVPGAPSKADREREIKALNKRLHAINMLENLRLGLQATEEWITRNTRYFLIQYNNRDRTVRVQGYNKPVGAADSYSQTENAANAAVTTVLVEVDKIESLKEAYPNYFLDVRLFTQHLRRVVQGVAQEEYVKDLSWIRDFTRPRRG
jgi:ppGpp synthetase/RelA/SpoT-type nucleotidyltranferase